MRISLKILVNYRYKHIPFVPLTVQLEKKHVAFTASQHVLDDDKLEHLLSATSIHYALVDSRKTVLHKVFLCDICRTSIQKGWCKLSMEKHFKYPIHGLSQQGV